MSWRVTSISSPIKVPHFKECLECESKMAFQFTQVISSRGQAVRLLIQFSVHVPGPIQVVSSGHDKALLHPCLKINHTIRDPWFAEHFFDWPHTVQLITHNFEIPIQLQASFSTIERMPRNMNHVIGDCTRLCGCFARSSPPLQPTTGVHRGSPDPSARK